MELFKLVGKIFVDSDEAQKSISKTGEKADGLGTKLANGIGSAAKWAAGVAGAAAAVGGAMIAVAKDAASAADEIDKGSQRMRVSAEAYQELAYAANLSGVEMSTLEKAAKKLEGTDINFDDAISQIMAIGDESERTQAAIDMFGESIAYQMTPLLNAGADGLADMRKEANELGLVMSETSVKDGAAMNDMFAKIEASIGALKNSLMAEFMPYVMEILQWVIDNAPLISSTVKNVMDKLMPIIEPILKAIMAAVKAVFSLLSGDFEGFSESIKDMLKNLGDALLTLGKNAINFLWEGMKAAWEGISNWVSEKVSWLADKLTFWNNGTSQMAVADGVHASGLAFVPFDGYKAELHRGEAVLNSNDASTLLDKVNQIAQNSGSGETVIPVSIELDGAVLARTMYRYNKAESNRVGGSLVMA